MASTRGDKTPAVPRFSSFRPKPAAAPESKGAREAEERSPDRDGDGDGDRHGSRRGEEHRRKPHSHRHHHGRRRSRSAERLPDPPPPPPPHDGTARGKEEPLFIIDKRGDPLIARYGSNDRGRVPAYRRHGLGGVLGAPGRLAIVRDGPGEAFSLGGGREGGSAFRDRSALARASRKPRFLRPGQEEERADPLVGRDEDFLPLSSSRKRKRKPGEGEGEGEGEGGASGDDADDRAHYRSIRGKAKVEDFADSDLGSEDSSDGQEDDPSQHPARTRAAELSRRTKEHPGDIDSWLQLIDLQAALLQLGGLDSADQETPDGARGLASIRVSLYEEALPHAAAEADRERVLLGLMREGARVWSPRALARRWGEVSSGDSTFALWKARLDHELTDLAGFTFERLRQFHLGRLQLLRQKTAAAETSQDGLAGLCSEMVYVFLRTTRYLQDTGFSELAVAAWQALLETTFARPAEALGGGGPGFDAASSFRDFWESEVARIGEENAKGWRHFAEEVDDAPEPKPGPAAAAPATRDVYTAWAAAEQRHAQAARMPARTMDDGTEDDPYRVVMYSDVEPLLLYIPTPALARAKGAVFDAFLLFCELPPALGTDPLVRTASADPFIRRAGTSFEDSLRAAEAAPAQSEHESARKQANLAQGSACAALSPQVLFTGPGWFNVLDHWRRVSRGGAGGRVESAWVARTARQVALAFGFGAAAEYSLALAWNSEPGSAKKAARALLKQYPSSVALYNAYALAEWHGGSRDVAEKVLGSATGQGLGQGAGAQLLWNTWAWMELDGGRKEEALGRLVASAQASGGVAAPSEALRVAPAQVLKARQHLAARRDYLLSSGGVDEACLSAESHALLEYLAAPEPREPMSDQQGDISAALSSVAAFSGDMVARGREGSPAHERFLQFAARLLYHHARSGPFRPTYLRGQLETFIRLFPRNTIFLALFAWAESSLRIDDPVRGLLDKVVLAGDRDTISSRLFAIAHERHVGTVHSTRTAFESALGSHAGRGSASLWSAYIRFCHGNGELRAKAKDVYYRAVASCPWSKEVALEAFTTLARDMGSSELRAVFNTMAEKGVRIHVDLDEFASTWGGGQQKQS